jgi:hypothetical protein
MSSWANRHIPRKRDISQIPEPLRPQIISRIDRPEIIQSESFQEVSQNPNVVSTRTNETKKPIEPVVNTRQYIVKNIAIPSPSAIELVHNSKSVVFVILRHLRTTRDNDLWISSYNSIRKFYINKIVIIDDNSSINTVDGKLVNTEVIKSEFNGAGEILPYYYFLKYKWADKMIFLHDSMFINRPFRDTEIEADIKFHWYFNIAGQIHDFRKINNFLSILKNNIELQAFASDTDTKWYGCFGGATICSIDIIQYLEDEYNIFNNLTLYIKNRKDRETFERVLGLVLYYEGILKDEACSNFGNIMSYPYAFDSNNTNYETASVVLRQKGYDSAIIKVWRGR